VTWQQWFLIVYLLGQIVRLFYMVDRPRETTSLPLAIVGTAEFGFLIYLVWSIQ
jgi:hypothetical protein